MRALWYPGLKKDSKYHIEGDPFHHLVNVIRIRSGEEVLLLNGRGLGIKTQVEEMSKKSLLLRFIEELPPPPALAMDLALGIPKKESLELCLKEATELGFRKIYLVRATFSQIKVPDAERIQNLLVSALEQANAFYLPEIISADWQTLPWKEYGSALLLNSQSKENTASQIQNKASHLLIIGPEGGFAPEELKFLMEQKNTESLHLPTPILRTSTAVATGAGVILQRLMD